MAKRKKKRSGGRRRIGSASARGYKDILMIGAGVVIGGPAMVAATKALVPPTLNPTMVSVGQIAVGGVIAKNSNSPFMKGLGFGGMAVGGAKLLAPLTAKISGPGDYYDDGLGYDNLDDGLDDEDYMSGLEDDMDDDNMMAGDDFL